MTEEDFARLKGRFLKYVRTYRMGDPSEQRNIALKRTHTLNVCRDMGFICRGEGLDEKDALIARAAALLHDTGRFPQYAKFRTFDDRTSINHGLIGAEVLMEERFLEGLSRSEQSLIIRAVKYHNAYAIPRLDRRAVFFLKLLRDADKLDIWKVMLQYFAQPAQSRAAAAGLGLPEGADVSAEIIPVILENRVVPIALVKSLNDYKLLLLSWVFGINFKTTFRLFSGRHYARDLASCLPQTDEVRRAVLHIEDFVRSCAFTKKEGGKRKRKRNEKPVQK